MESVQIIEAYPERACHRPGETVHLTVHVANPHDEQVPVKVVATVRCLADPVAHIEQTITPHPGDQVITLTWLPPPDQPRGYGVDLCVLDGQGTVLSTTSTAFDVLERWTQAPRYGFLTDFSPDRRNIEETMRWLVRYHINGLQFYDWMYRHEDLLTAQEPYRDPLGRLLSRHTVEALIDAAHRRNIAAMPYTAIYGASVPFAEAHPEWTLRKANGEPFSFGEDFLRIMNPSPDSPWTRHLMREFAEVLRETAFDGIHLDQYGDPKSGFDAQGRPVDLATVIPAFIHLTRETVSAIRADGAVVFNAVNNWPIESVAQAPQDFLYIEVWPPHTRYHDLWKLIVNAQTLGQGKPVVLAAYVDPDRPRNVRLTNAVIFASGGYHIELGEPGGMLADPYFPLYKPMGKALATVMRRYYDFAVRYEQVLSLGTRDATVGEGRQVTIHGVSTDPEGAQGTVWPIVRQGDGFTAINLINLRGISDPAWNGLLPTDPTPMETLHVRYQTDREVRRAWLASPDFSSPQAIALDIASGQDAHGRHIEWTIPRLEYWDLVVIEFADG